jgi:hypothetical protein
LTALQWIHPRAHSLPVMSHVFAKNDCSAVDLSLSVVVAGFYSIQARNKSYKC